ncbi:hypothetical protein [Psychrosphaera algicola]|uniref:Uncharacterized protein n=1 Tax=Psychrosphaera algicola TaxID=3023714 RepID=A0ABT5FHE1_9GAMM|nr:hypothetical protein [Psychrosphaera sp. G1-22]MDC2890621.1 hypothetical protein [Psychrosphaera sp. G1-22]
MLTSLLKTILDGYWLQINMIKGYPPLPIIADKAISLSSPANIWYWLILIPVQVKFRSQVWLNILEPVLTRYFSGEI